MESVWRYGYPARGGPNRDGFYYGVTGRVDHRHTVTPYDVDMFSVWRHNYPAPRESSERRAPNQDCFRHRVGGGIENRNILGRCVIEIGDIGVSPVRSDGYRVKKQIPGQ